MNVPNLLTVLRMLAAPVLLAVFSIGSWVSDMAALAIVAAAGVTDLLDGYLARLLKQSSSFGKIMDPLADAFIFLTLFGCFAAAEWVPVWVFAVFVARETFMHVFLRPYFLMKGVALAAKSSGKLKTTFQNIVGIGVLLAMAATRSSTARPGSLKTWLMGIAFWAVLATALLSVASLRPYVAEFWRSRGAATAPGGASGA